MLIEEILEWQTKYNSLMELYNTVLTKIEKLNLELEETKNELTIKKKQYESFVQAGFEIKKTKIYINPDIPYF